MKRFLVVGNVQTFNEKGERKIDVIHGEFKTNNAIEAIGIFTDKLFAEILNPTASLKGRPLAIEIDDTKYKRIIKKLWERRNK